MRVQILAPQRPPRENYLKCKRTERIARNHIEKLGYQFTSQATSSGPDLVGWKLGKPYFFEVKPAQRCSKFSWQTDAVQPLRRNDHFIAIVLPNKYVFIQPMEHHLARCAPSGTRTVTDLVKKFCPEFYQEPLAFLPTKKGPLPSSTRWRSLYQKANDLATECLA